MKKIKENIIKHESIYNILLIISAIIFNLSITQSNKSKYTLYIKIFQILVTVLVFIYLLFIKHYLTKIVNLKSNKLNLLLSIFFTVESSKIIMINSNKYTFWADEFIKKINDLTHLNIDKLYIIEKIGAFILMLPLLMIIWYLIMYYCVPKIKDFIKSLSKTEKKFLIISGILFSVFIFIINISTNAFTYPITKENTFINYDVLYTTDNGEQISTNSFTNFSAVENDLRQPLFGVFAFPFGLISKVGTDILSFLPSKIVYSFFISILQVVCLLICSILLCRLINKKSSIFNLIFYLLMFPTIFFALNIEQYVFGLFWLILLIYYFVEKNKSNPILFSATTGSLITNGILLPFIIFKKNFKKFIKDGIKYLFVFIFIIVLFGKAYNTLFDILNYSNFTRFMGIKVSFIDRLLQYISFISSCFIAPKGYVDLNYGSPVHPSYQLMSVTSVNILGIVLLVLMIISFILNYKKKIAKISFGWLIFSFIVLVLVGWGTVENGLIIYGIYFSWAYFILIGLLFNQLLSKVPKLKNIVWCLIFGIMIFINGLELINIIKFGITYYPFVS